MGLFLAAMATRTSVRATAKSAKLSERRIQRWVAFNGFIAQIEEALQKAKIAKVDTTARTAFDADVDLFIAGRNRELQLAAHCYAGGDRDRLHEMWMSGELMAIHEREAIAGLRRHGKNDLADYYERALAGAPPWQPRDYVGEEMRRVGFEWPPP